MSQDATNGASPSGHTSESVRFGFAARLEHLKGPLQLIEGFRIADRAQTAVELLIAGEGSLRQQITGITARDSR